MTVMATILEIRRVRLFKDQLNAVLIKTVKIHWQY